MKRTKSINPIPPEARARKATKGELRTRVVFTMKMLCDGHHKCYIKEFFRNNYGVGARQVETYIRLAREQLLKQLDVPKEVLVSESFGFLMQVLQDPKASWKDKINARKEANALLGLNAPTKIAPTTPEGQALPGMVVVNPTELSDDELELMVKIRQRSQQAGHDKTAEEA